MTKIDLVVMAVTAPVSLRRYMGISQLGGNHEYPEAGTTERID
jgi:hypothetical protein